MIDMQDSDGTPLHEVTVTLKLLVREGETKQMARDIRRMLASRQAIMRVLTGIVTIGVEGPDMITRNRRGRPAHQTEDAYQCHVCCSPGPPCPCDARPHGEDEFCDCIHENRRTR
jgi:hypothetical protein